MASTRKRIRATIASTTGNIAVDIARDKEETKNLLGAAEIIRNRKGDVVRTEEGLQPWSTGSGTPSRLEPIDGNHGKGNTTRSLTGSRPN